jgi:hypothetical protein
MFKDQQTSVVLLTKANKMLAEVKTIDEAKYIKDIASAAKMFAQKHKLGKEAVASAREIEMEAEFKLGELLKQMDKNKGEKGRFKPSNTGTTCGEVPAPPTYNEIGIGYKEASEAQQLASLPAEEKEKVKRGIVSKKKALESVKKKSTSKPKNVFKPELDIAGITKLQVIDGVGTESFETCYDAFFAQVKLAKRYKWQTVSQQIILSRIKILFDVTTT